LCQPPGHPPAAKQTKGVSAVGFLSKKFFKNLPIFLVCFLKTQALAACAAERYIASSFGSDQALSHSSDTRQLRSMKLSHSLGCQAVKFSTKQLQKKEKVLICFDCTWKKQKYQKLFQKNTIS
jgi:cysteine sulfinate desulfinase/cysteine desulfurase-like protein